MRWAIDPLPPMPEPKFATERDRSLFSVGPRQAEFARVFQQKPFLRWQKLVTDVAGERLRNGRARYKLVLVTVQRQAGKTHMDFGVSCERCFSRPGFRAFYTAQSGKDAQKSFLKHFDGEVKGTPLAALTKVRRGNGLADLTFLNGSVYSPTPPTEEAGHGDQSDRVTIDEGWAFTNEQGAEIMQAVGPTQITRPDGQIWIISAGGTAKSTWLAELVARGRENDPDICFFEWGIPDDLPLDDDQAIAEFHPAYGELVTADSIRELRTLFGEDSAAFARAAGNRWTEVIGGVIGAQLWRSVQDADPIPEGVPIGYGAARAADGSQVVIAAAARLPDRIIIEILDVIPTAWQVGRRLMDWATDGPVATAPGGPSAPLYSELVKLAPADRLVKVGDGAAAAACATMLDAMPSRGIVFRPHTALDDAVRVAGKRIIQDGGWVWARVQSGPPIVALDAATYALAALLNAPPPAPAPVIRT